MGTGKAWAAASGMVACISGILLHFAYEWFGGTLWAVLGAVNESTWEHLKLLFWPVTAMTLIEYVFYGKNMQGFIQAKFISLLLGMALIVTAFYTYYGVLGFHFLAADIAVFIVGIAVSYCITVYLMEGIERNAEKSGILTSSAFGAIWAWEGIVLLAMIFIVFTYAPPHIGIFLDPVTGGYGISMQ